MKNLKRIVIAIVAIVAVAAPASAQFRLGIKGGLDIAELSTSGDLLNNFDVTNRTGYTLGLTSEFTVPVIGLGLDLSVMYVHRVTEYDTTNPSADQLLEHLFKDDEYRKSDYIEIPLNLKYKLSLPVVSQFVSPYITTGPSVAFKCSKTAAIAAWEEKKFDAAWNLGGGVELLKHLQVGVNYSWGLTNKIGQKVGIDTQFEPIDIKNNGWKITAAYYF